MRPRSAPCRRRNSKRARTSGQTSRRCWSPSNPRRHGTRRSLPRSRVPGGRK
jgi:hypothetical protein